MQQVALIWWQKAEAWKERRSKLEVKKGKRHLSLSPPVSITRPPPKPARGHSRDIKSASFHSQP
eukprot:scaffold14046_cov115-Skeletonema_marinoi.AAC.3